MGQAGRVRVSEHFEIAECARRLDATLTRWVAGSAPVVTGR
jgi:hypothetical protein